MGLIRNLKAILTSIHWLTLKHRRDWSSCIMFYGFGRVKRLFSVILVVRTQKVNLPRRFFVGIRNSLMWPLSRVTDVVRPVCGFIFQRNIPLNRVWLWLAALPHFDGVGTVFDGILCRHAGLDAACQTGLSLRATAFTDFAGALSDHLERRCLDHTQTYKCLAEGEREVLGVGSDQQDRARVNS